MTADAAARAEWALNAAQLCGYEFNASFAWLHKAVDADPSAYPEWLEGWVHYHAYLHLRELRLWIESLDHAGRNSSIARVIGDELNRFQRSENERRSAYLWHRLTH
jgi:hypothetical protein